MSDPKSDHQAETLQIGVTPVQSFSSPVIAPNSPEARRERHGRPERKIENQVEDPPEDDSANS